MIADLGEILIPFGEFLDDSHVVVRGACALAWYGLLLQKALGSLPGGWEAASAAQAMAWCRDLGIPLHPRHNLFFHDLTVEELGRLRERIAVEGRLEDGRLSVPAEEAFREPLVRLGALYAVRAGRLVLERHTDVLFATLGISERDGTFHVAPNPEEADPLAFVSRLAGFPVRARAPSRIGARMARPEKAAPRKMQPAPHPLFPIGHEGGAQRLLLDAAAKAVTRVAAGRRVRSSTGRRSF